MAEAKIMDWHNCYDGSWKGGLFVDQANENFALHYSTWQTFGDPQPEIVQGDSRRMTECVWMNYA